MECRTWFSGESLDLSTLVTRSWLKASRASVRFSIVPEPKSSSLSLYLGFPARVAEVGKNFHMAVEIGVDHLLELRVLGSLGVKLSEAERGHGQDQNR